MRKKRKANPDKKGRLRRYEEFTPLTGDLKYVLMHINFVSIRTVNHGNPGKSWVSFNCDLHGRDVTSQVNMLYGRRIVESYRNNNGRVRYRAVSMEMWQAALDNSLYAMM